MNDFKPQVDSKYYFSGYDTKERWISYWHQIDEVLKTKPKSLLEVGIGNGTVSNYLKNLGIKVTTVDIDENLKPDYVCSVTKLSKIFDKNSFDTTLCAEVLEHIPFKYFEKSLKELSYVTKNYLILSLPHFGINFSFTLKLPSIKKLSFTIKIPYPKRHKFNGQHYWEIGKKHYPLKKITKIIEKYFLIRKTYTIPENPYHRFFVLKKI